MDETAFEPACQIIRHSIYFFGHGKDELAGVQSERFPTFHFDFRRDIFEGLRILRIDVWGPAMIKYAVDVPKLKIKRAAPQLRRKVRNRRNFDALGLYCLLYVAV